MKNSFSFTDRFVAIKKRWYLFILLPIITASAYIAVMGIAPRVYQNNFIVNVYHKKTNGMTNNEYKRVKESDANISSGLPVFIKKYTTLKNTQYILSTKGLYNQNLTDLNDKITVNWIQGSSKNLITVRSTEKSYTKVLKEAFLIGFRDALKSSDKTINVKQVKMSRKSQIIQSKSTFSVKKVVLMVMIGFLLALIWSLSYLGTGRESDGNK